MSYTCANVLHVPSIILYYSCSDLEPWWHQRQGIVERSDSSDDGSSALSQSDYEEEREERRTARFTEYSMSSSVVPRSEGVSNTCILCCLHVMYMYVCIFWNS